MTEPDIFEITDSHCHLDFPDFEGELEDVIARGQEAGVTRMVSICTRRDGLARVREISEGHAGVFHAYGIHPMRAHEEALMTVDELLRDTGHPKCVGIGETGLDYHYTAETAEVQQQSLRVHIAAARATGLPLIIHSRDADDDMARILTEEHAKGRFPCVMHCFSSSAALAQTALDLGFYLSMSGITAFPKSEELRNIFAAAPLDRILVETDAPYLAPPPKRGKRNEPAYTAHTARRAAETFGMEYKDFAAATQANFDRLFTKVAQWQAAA